GAEAKQGVLHRLGDDGLGSGRERLAALAQRLLGQLGQAPVDQGAPELALVVDREPVAAAGLVLPEALGERIGDLAPEPADDRLLDGVHDTTAGAAVWAARASAT